MLPPQISRGGIFKGCKMRTIIAVLLALVCGLAQAQSQMQPFTPSGNTATFTANTSGNLPTPVQATGCPTGSNCQYLITNIGVNGACIGYGTSANATANAVIPTSTPTFCTWVLPGTQIIITTGYGSYFTGITASGTSVFYVQPGIGQ